MDLNSLAPRADLLAAAVLLDLLVGDPVYRWHPIRLIGASLTGIENRLRTAGADGRGGGCILFVGLAVVWVGGAAAAVAGLSRAHPAAGVLAHLFLLYSLIALGDLLAHADDVDAAVRAGDLAAARAAAGRLVGRDTAPMDGPACRRAAIESLGESLVDGVIAPLFWYAAGGVPGIVAFKVISTMDSMVGYRNARYRRFGWCGARLDDAANLLPARIGWILIAIAAAAVPGASGRGALRRGWRQHGVVPGPNAGWSEAALAGAIRRRLVGPIHAGGRLVTDVWIGDPEAPAAGTAVDYTRARRTVVLAAGLAAGGAATLLAAR